tara:strand:+ start:1051 stop:2118 length:1068 start_codon:yes stop_codon:yes gene_type:complete
MIKPKKTISNLWRPEPDISKRSDYFRFERNERTTLFSDEQFSDILDNLTPYDLVAYGELEPFYEKICYWLDIGRKNILLTSGSDAGIKAVFETYISEKDEALVSLPNYAMFSVYASMFGAKEVQHFYEKDLKLDVGSFIKKINLNTKLIIVSNPGHTGRTVPKDEMIKIIEEGNRNNSLVVIDEAYFQFFPETMIDLINKFDNLLIIRTFSKAFGLASLRIGLLIGSENIIRELYKVKLVHEITGLAAKIGIYMLDHMHIVNRYVDAVNKGKIILYERLENIGFEVFKSESNFLFFKTPNNLNPLALKQYLEENRILIRGPFGKHPFDDHLRITIGDEKQMNYFCDTIEDFLINN